MIYYELPIRIFSVGSSLFYTERKFKELAKKIGGDEFNEPKKENTQKKSKKGKTVYNVPEVKAVYLMSGGYDFMVMLEGKTMKEISMFTSSKLAPLESVVSTVTHFVLKKYKDHGTVLEAKKVDERQAVTP